MFNYTPLNSRFLKAFVTVTAIFLSTISQAAVDTETNANSIILAGHDAVAYFTQGKPVIGKKSITAVYNDAIYRFSSTDNRDTFVNNPKKYAPAYGGFCAYGMTFGKKFTIDGKAFEVVNGVLYVNKNLDVYKAWKEDVPKHLQEANSAWPEVKMVAADKL
ncbi:MAG: YHS domain protein [Colwellia sp.]|nr:YHS domain protein [Colwellia sp.]